MWCGGNHNIKSVVQMKKCGAKWVKFYLTKVWCMLNLYNKLRRLIVEKNEKWVGEKVGCMLDICWFLFVKFGVNKAYLKRFLRVKMDFTWF